MKRTLITTLAIIAGLTASAQGRMTFNEVPNTVHVNRNDFLKIGKCDGKYIPVVKRDGLTYFMDLNGHISENGLDFKESFYTNFNGADRQTVAIQDVGLYFKYAIISTDGKVIKKFPDNASRISEFVDGVAVIKIDGKYKYINMDGDFIFPKIVNDNTGHISPLMDGLRRFYDSEKRTFGFMDENGEIVIEPIFPYASNFSEGYAVIAKEQKYPKEDISGYSAIDNPTYKFVKWSYIDRTGKIVSDREYTNMPGDIHDGNGLIKLTNSTYTFVKFIDGRPRYADFYDEAREYAGGYTYAVKDGKRLILDKDGIDRTKEKKDVDFSSFKYIRNNHDTLLPNGQIWNHQYIIDADGENYQYFYLEYVNGTIGQWEKDRNTTCIVNYRGQILLMFETPLF